MPCRTCCCARSCSRGRFPAWTSSGSGTGKSFSCASATRPTSHGLQQLSAERLPRAIVVKARCRSHRPRERRADGASQRSALLADEPDRQAVRHRAGEEKLRRHRDASASYGAAVLDEPGAVHGESGRSQGALHIRRGPSGVRACRPRRPALGHADLQPDRRQEFVTGRPRAPGHRPKLPAGWSYESRTLASPLRVDTRGQDAEVTQDDLANSYSLETDQI